MEQGSSTRGVVQDMVKSGGGDLLEVIGAGLACGGVGVSTGVPVGLHMVMRREGTIGQSLRISFNTQKLKVVAVVG